MLKWWNLSLLFRQRKFNHVLYLPILYYSMKKTKNIFHNFKFFYLNKIYTLRSVWVSLHSCMNLTKQEITFQLGENYYKKDCRHNFKCFLLKEWNVWFTQRYHHQVKIRYEDVSPLKTDCFYLWFYCCRISLQKQLGY